MLRKRKGPHKHGETKYNLILFLCKQKGEKEGNLKGHIGTEKINTFCFSKLKIRNRGTIRGHLEDLKKLGYLECKSKEKRLRCGIYVETEYYWRVKRDLKTFVGIHNYFHPHKIGEFVLTLYFDQTFNDYFNKFTEKLKLELNKEEINLIKTLVKTSPSAFIHLCMFFLDNRLKKILNKSDELIAWLFYDFLEDVPKGNISYMLYRKKYESNLQKIDWEIHKKLQEDYELLEKQFKIKLKFLDPLRNKLVETPVVFHKKELWGAERRWQIINYLQNHYD